MSNFLSRNLLPLTIAALSLAMIGFRKEANAMPTYQSNPLACIALAEMSRNTAVQRDAGMPWPKVELQLSQTLRRSGGTENFPVQNREDALVVHQLMQMVYRSPFPPDKVVRIIRSTCGPKQMV